MWDVTLEFAWTTVVSKTKHSKTKTEARSTQNSKTKHPKLENEAQGFSLSRVGHYAARGAFYTFTERILFFPRHTFRGQEDGPCILGNYFLKIKILVSFVFTQDHFLDADAVH